MTQPSIAPNTHRESAARPESSGFTALRHFVTKTLLATAVVGVPVGGAVAAHDALTVSPAEHAAAEQAERTTARAEMKALAEEGKLAVVTVPSNVGAEYVVDQVNDIGAMTQVQKDAAVAFVKRQAPGGILQNNAEYVSPLVKPDKDAAIVPVQMP
jgi:hypothetical protein